MSRSSPWAFLRSSRRIYESASNANHHPPWLDHNELMSVKCEWNPSGASRHFWMAGVICVEALPDQMDLQGSGDLLVQLAENFLNSTARCCGCSEPITSPVAAFSVPNSVAARAR